MSHLPGYMVTPFCVFLFSAFPGVLLINFFAGFNSLSKIIATLFLSLGCWVCISWFISWAGLPLGRSAFSLQLLFIAFYLAYNYSRFIKLCNTVLPGLKVSKVMTTPIPAHYFVLCVVMLLYLFPVLFITI